MDYNIDFSDSITEIREENHTEFPVKFIPVQRVTLKELSLSNTIK